MACIPPRVNLANLMESRRRESILVSVVVAVLVLLLPLLAALQYRWLGQLSEAERTQIRDFLQVAANRFSLDFNNELSSVYETFLVAPGASAGGPPDLDLRKKYAKWVSASPTPHLLKNVWLATAEAGKDLALSRFVPQTGALEPSSWPAGLNPLRNQLERQ